jgi:hypothetical protein
MWGTSPQFCKKALPKMIKQADSSELRRAFENHLKETEGQVERLEQVFVLYDAKAAGKTCPAIEGILEEGAEDRPLSITRSLVTARRSPGPIARHKNRHERGGDAAQPDALAGIQRRPYSDRACGEQPEPAGRCLNRRHSTAKISRTARVTPAVLRFRLKSCTERGSALRVRPLPAN